MQYTPHYGFIILDADDAVTSDVDFSRWTILDNQLWFQSNLIGDGVIQGWDISVTGNILTVSYGLGIIDGVVTQTFGDLSYPLLNNRRSFISMIKKPNVTADLSSFSGINTVTYVDSTAPSVPTGLAVTDSDYDFIVLYWYPNTEPDLDHYEIHRDDGSGFKLLDTTTTIGYVDTDVVQDFTYNYKIASVDVNNLVSSLTGSVTGTTGLDLRAPGDPQNVDVIPGSAAIQVVWDSANYLADHYLVTMQPVDTTGVPEGSPILTDTDDFQLITTDLLNGQTYKVTVQSVSVNGVLSGGVTQQCVPAYSEGAQEFSAFTVSEVVIDSSYNLELILDWTLQEDEYTTSPPPAYYFITVSTTQADGVASYYPSAPASIVSYTTSDSSTDTISENTLYIIQIQSVSDDGIPSQPYTIRHKTKKYSPPGPVSSLVIASGYSPTTKFVEATWTNSTTTFSYNALTITKTLLVTAANPAPVTTTLVDNLNIGTSQSYILPKPLIDNYASYTFSITVYDAFGNTSQSVGASTVLDTVISDTFLNGSGVITGSRPSAPTIVNAVANNDEATIFWNTVVSDYVIGYHVWRAQVQGQPLVSTDFVAVAETDADTFSYTDYGVVNGNQYFYFVTAIDEFGQESPNPVTDNFIGYTYAVAEPRSHSSLNPPPAIDLTIDPQSTHDVVLTWTQDSDSFDGYLVYRKLNDGEWTNIGNVDAFATQYTDSGALYKTGVYSYMIRKFINEGQLLVTIGTASPANSLPLATIVVANNEAETPVVTANNINNLADPVRAEANRQLQSGTHQFYSDNDDERIRLSDNLEVTQWDTTDYQTYTTNQDIRGTSTYIVYVNGVQSPTAAYIDVPSQTLTFVDYIYLVGDTTDTAPTVSVVFTNTGEVTGVLPATSIDKIIASKVKVGILSSDVIGQIDHFGRFRETCTPLAYPLNYINGYQFSGSTPLGTTFYDVIKLPDGRILAASSNGVMITLMSDVSIWNTPLPISVTSSPPIKVYYSEINQWFMVLAGNSVYYSIDLIKWVPIQGTEGATFVRDLAEDSLGNFFVSSDSGVYQLNPGDSVKPFWSQTNTIDVLDQNVFGLYWDQDNSELLASASNGIYSTTDSGTTWTRVGGKEVQVPVYCIRKDSGCLFLVSENKIWRMCNGEDQFSAISSFSVSCRKLEVFVGTIYLTTDSGLLASDTESNIYEDSLVSLTEAFSNLSVNGIMPVITALSKQDSRLWIGMDAYLYSVTQQRSLILNGDFPGTQPIIALNGVTKNVGVYYSTANVVAFDTQIPSTEIPTIVNQYYTYNLKNGGWVDTKFDAELTLVINGDDQNPPGITLISGTKTINEPADPVHVPNDAVYVSDATTGIAVPNFNARNSNFNEAFAYLTQLVQIQDSFNVDAVLTPTKIITPDRVALLYNTIYLFQNSLNTDLQSQVQLPTMGGSVVTASGISYDYDAVNGTITVYSGVNKYTNVAFTIKDAGVSNAGQFSHVEIDDAFEKINSGLPASLAAVQQSNIVRMGILDRHENITERSLPWQAKYNIACDAGWYDKVKSTVDYYLEIEQNPTKILINGVFTYGSFSIEYPADILYLADLNQVWVCGDGGILSISTVDYECTAILVSEFYFHNMCDSGDAIYAMADDGIYIIDRTTLVATKDVDQTLPMGYNSVIRIGDTYYVGTTTGLYVKRDFEPSWRLIVALNNGFIRQTSNLTFFVGLDPTDSTGNTYQVYFSYGGGVWNQSDTIKGYVVADSALRYSTVYYATNIGLLSEDLSGFGTGGQALDLNGDGDPDLLNFNAVDANQSIMVAGADDGSFYVQGNNTLNGQSLLQTIHKVKAVGSQYWLFCNNLVQIEGLDRLVKLTTGKVIA